MYTRPVAQGNGDSLPGHGSRDRHGHRDGNHHHRHDSTLILAYCNSIGLTATPLDPATLTLGSPVPLSLVTSQGTGATWEDVIWSDRDPDLLYLHDDARLWSLAVSTVTWTLLRDFTTELGAENLMQMSRGGDDDVFAWHTDDRRGGTLGYLVYRRSDDQVIARAQQLGQFRPHRRVPSTCAGRTCRVLMPPSNLRFSTRRAPPVDVGAGPTKRRKQGSRHDRRAFARRSFWLRGGARSVIRDERAPTPTCSLRGPALYSRIAGPTLDWH